MTTAKVEIPKKLIPVFTGEARYRGAYGGRGSGKTRAFAKMAAVRAYAYEQVRETGVILCAREFQNSLDESSMMEVKQAIESEPWLRPWFDIGESYIRTKSGRISFKFTGLRRNIDSIKSKARILICWIDEAEPVTAGAWKKLIPTVREDGSEIWITWNPEIENSATDQIFRKDAPPNSKIVEVNWEDNPWFPDVLRQEMERDRQRDPDKYLHVWQGGYESRTDARVFHNWRVDDFDTPDDARFYFGADWGYSIDPSVLVRCWLSESRSALYIDHEAYQVGCEIEALPALFAGDCPHRDDPDMSWSNAQGHPGIPGAYKWPIVADSARPETISFMRRKGFNIKPARKGKGSVEDGIEFLKSYDIIVHPRCKRTIDELRSYRWKVDRNTEDVLPVLEDKHNHVIDSLRYAIEAVRRAPDIPVLNFGGEKQLNWAEPR